VESACKKQRLTDAPTFKREGNQQQYTHSEKVLSSVESALQSIDSIDVDGAKASLKLAVKTIKERQKLIRLADRSELGWGVVKEYIADDLASDSGDEKRIRKAEKAAAAKKPAASFKKRTTSYTGSRPANTMSLFRATRAPFVPFVPRRQPSFRSFRFNDNRICFQCGIQGHVRTACPALRAQQQQPGPSNGN
jgi:hypothetical protein